MNHDDILNAAQILKDGGLVAFPTETVYGLGARMSCAEAIQKVYQVKGRPTDNPLIVHISERSQVDALTLDVHPAAQALMDRFWPGPLTFVCKRSPRVPASVTAGLGTVAVRMPAHPVAQALIRALGEPIAAPSANRSGRPSPTRYQDVVDEVGRRVEMVLDGGRSNVGLESTVLDVTHYPFRILRPGSVTIEDLKSVEPKIEHALPHVSKEAAASPGMKHAHYQPLCEVVLVEGARWIETAALWARKEPKMGYLTFSQSIPSGETTVYGRKFVGEKDFARNLYASFFEAEKAGVRVLLVEIAKEEGVGRALMDRLRRAAAARESLLA